MGSKKPYSKALWVQGLGFKGFRVQFRNVTNGPAGSDYRAHRVAGVLQLASSVQDSLSTGLGFRVWGLGFRDISVWISLSSYMLFRVEGL